MPNGVLLCWLAIYIWNVVRCDYRKAEDLRCLQLFQLQTGVPAGFAATNLWHKSLRRYAAARLFNVVEEWFAQHPFYGALPVLYALSEPRLQGGTQGSPANTVRQLVPSVRTLWSMSR